MALFKAALVLALVAVAAAQTPPSYEGSPWNDYVWAKSLDASAAQLPGVVASSPDVCQGGNGGVRGLSFSGCLKLCSSLAECTVASWYPIWFGGPPACFVYNNNNSTVLAAATSKDVVQLTPLDQGVFVGVKKAVAGKGPWPKFLWTKGGSSTKDLIGPLFASSDLCENGNGGIRGLSHASCLDLCIDLGAACKASSYFTTWFGGPSACFAYSDITTTLKKAATMKVLVPSYLHNGNYVGVKR